MRSSSSKAGGVGRRGKAGKPLLSDHVIKVRERLHEALSLGIKVDDNKERKWQCSDTEIQLHVLRAMANFIGCASRSVLQLPVVKDSVSDMFLALEAILCSRNERVLSFAADTTQNLLAGLGDSICQYGIWGVFVCLSRCLSKCNLQVVNSCVIAMDNILKRPGVMRWENDEETWKVLKENDTVGSLVLALQDVHEDQPYEYFTQIASLLRTILLKCPPARYYVWKFSDLIMKLGSICSHRNPSLAAVALELFATLALCGDVAMELLRNKEIVSKAVQGMEPSHSCLVRVEALKVCQSLMRSAKGCHMLISVYCEPVVQGIISAMGEPTVPVGLSALRMGAFRAALIACWSGDHHLCFWKLGIDKVLFDILLGDCSMININQNPLPTEMLFSKIYECYVGVRVYIWDILGWLAIYCEDKFLFKTDQRLWYLKVLIFSVCSAAKVTMHRRHVKLPSDNFEFEPVRAALQMLCSPNKYISSHAKHYLSECLQSDGHKHLEYLLESLTLIATGDVSLTSDSFQTVVNIVSLGCYSTLSEYQIPILEKRGVYITSAIINRCLRSDIKLSWSAISSHIARRNPYIRACCWSHTTDWEGENMVLFHCLQALAQLLNVSYRRCDHQKNSIGKVQCALCEISEAQFLVDNLQYVLSKNFSPGTKSYAACVLSFFNFYGFPSKLGKRLERTLGENELADLQFVFSNGQVLNAHSVILLARCPALLPREENLNDKELGDVLTERHVFEQKPTRFRREVSVSDQVDAMAFKKILEYVYSGLIQVEGEYVPPVKKIAKFCGLNSLLYMLRGRLPKWGLDTPICDLTQAFEPACLAYTDIMLEAEATEGVAWNCSICQFSMPHMCTHKVVLSSSCDYFRALFSSGMRDSNADVLKVPIGWNALVKLVKWMYSAELPRINHGCAWNHMDEEQQLSELQAYVELASLADYWLIDGLQEECLNAIITLLNVDHQIILKTIAIAASLNQKEIVKVAISSIASLYPKLRDAGDLESFDEVIVDIFQAEYIQCVRESNGLGD